MPFSYGRRSGTLPVTVMSWALVGVLVAGPPDLDSTAIANTRVPSNTATPATAETSRPVPVPGRAALAGCRGAAALVTWRVFGLDFTRSVCRSELSCGGETTQQRREPYPAPGASALDGPLGDGEQPGGVRH